MTFVTGLVIGLIIGWIIEWVIDLLYWRREDANGMYLQLAQAEEKIRQLEIELAEMSRATNEIIFQKKDSLEKLAGIEPIYAKRLNEAGIYTFAELADQTPERLREIVSVEDGQKIDPESWIIEARLIAREANKL